MNEIEDLKEEMQILLFNNYKIEQEIEQLSDEIYTLKNLVELILYLKFTVLFGFLIFLFI